MARRKLSDTGVANLKPRAKRYVEPDPELPGHYVRVAPSGRKTFMVVTRDDGGKQVWQAIGTADEITIEKAREKARQSLKSIRFTIGGPQTFKDVAEAWLVRHVKAKGLRSRVEIERQLRSNIFPVWASKDFASIKRSEVAKLLDAIEERNSPRQADYVLAIVRAICRWYAARNDDYVIPIAPGMRRTDPKARERKRILSDDEIRRLWRIESPFADFCRLALLTAQRRDKVASMCWQDVNVDGVWTIPTEAREKGNAGELVLPANALEIIKRQPRFSSNPYVFAGRGNKRINAWSQSKAALDASLPGVDAWVLHDLRRTARSLMARAGVRPDVAERVMGHVIGGVEGVYDRHSYRDEKADALKRLASLVEIIINPPVGNVVPIAGVCQ